MQFSILKNIDIRSDLRTEFGGESFTLNKIMHPDLFDNGIARSKVNLRNEIDYNPIGTARRIRNWAIYSQDLMGADPRGNDLRSRKEYGFEWREPLKKDFHSVLKLESHYIDNSSGFSDLRNRNVVGWWSEEEIKWDIERKWQFSVSALGGKDSGTHNQEKFTAYAYGLKFESQRFISSTSRIKIRTELFNSIETSDNSIIPPEALNGLPLGQSIINSVVSNFLISAISRLKRTPSVQITKVPIQYKRARVKEMHEELDRSYHGIVSTESIESEGRQGTRFKIKGEKNKLWSYEIFDNGDEYSSN